MTGHRMMSYKQAANLLAALGFKDVIANTVRFERQETYAGFTPEGAPVYDNRVFFDCYVSHGRGVDVVTKWIHISGPFVESVKATIV